jgi:rubrerythrin
MTQKEKLIKIFEYALNQEKTGLSFFEASLERMGSASAANAFKRLIAEEEKHIKFISGILEKLRNEEDIDVSASDETALEPTNYFDERAKSEFLEQCINESMVPDVTVFNTAWLIEKDLSEFYEKMSRQVEGAPAVALRVLARWEHAHEKFFKEFRDTLTDTYSKMPWGG